MKPAVHFLLSFGIAMLLAFGCAWIFGSALANTSPDGTLVFQPVDDSYPMATDGFHIGMAIDWFFDAACLLTVALSIFSLNRFKSTMLKPLPAPLFAASIVCAALIFVSVHLAGK